MPETTRERYGAQTLEQIVILQMIVSGKPDAEARQAVVAMFAPLVEAVRELREALEGEGVDLDNPAPPVLP